MKQIKKGAIEISFSWIFAVCAGIIIVFLAVFISSKIMKTGQETVSAKTGKEIQILLNPLETDFEDAQSTFMSLSVETRINNVCEKNYGLFGRQGIGIDQKNYNKWTQTKTKVYAENKYIFSNKSVEGKSFFIFSKPLNFPFKTADLFYFIPTNKNYCFVNTPQDILEELSYFNNQTPIKTQNCSEEDILVCFGGNPVCDINVIQELKGGYVVKNNIKTYFNGLSQENYALMYAAIFSDKQIYECQVQRLMSRVSELALVYSNKEENLEKIGCDGSLGEDLMRLREQSLNLNSSSELKGLIPIIEQIKLKNEIKGKCVLW